MTFPYDFDTTAVFRKVLLAGLALDIVLVAGIVYSILVTHEYIVVAQLLVIIGITVGFGGAISRRVEGSVGSLTAEAVKVERGRAVLGTYFPGPEGRFPISAFSAVRLEQASGPIDVGVQGGSHARIYLIGRGATPTILVARETGTGIHFAQDLASSLGLDLQDTRAPF